MVRRLRGWLRGPAAHDGMWRIGPAIAATLSVALLTAAVAIVVAWHVIEPRGEATVSDFVDIVVIILGLIAGGGGTVALVVAYRRQRVNERMEVHRRRAEDREQTRLLNERFQGASAQLGHDKVAVRLAGAHAMANLADDWDDHGRRQTCIDVLCSYLRDAGKEPSETAWDSREAWLADREVRHTILRIIADHLREHGPWTGHRFDLSGVTVDLHLDFRNAHFSTGSFISFGDAVFDRGRIDFEGARFEGGRVSFYGTEFRGGIVVLSATFKAGLITLEFAKFSGGSVWFREATFSGARVSLGWSDLRGGSVAFDKSKVTGGHLEFDIANFNGASVSFAEVEFISGRISFDSCVFRDGEISFDTAKFRGADVIFTDVLSWPGRSALRLPESAPGLVMPDDADIPFDSTKGDGDPNRPPSERN